MVSAVGDAVQHRQLKDSVYHRLREQIVSAELPPGYVLREAELAARFGVSKTPLREAFVRLEKDGFVTIPQRGRRRIQPAGPAGDIRGPRIA
jgi:DNA-binding GntR family transcriptional regulator